MSRRKGLVDLLYERSADGMVRVFGVAGIAAIVFLAVVVPIVDSTTVRLLVWALPTWLLGGGAMCLWGAIKRSPLYEIGATLLAAFILMAVLFSAAAIFSQVVATSAQ